MTYHDEIVDEVRAIRTHLCNQAGTLDNLLATLRAEELTHTGRMAKQLNGFGKVKNFGLYGVPPVFDKTHKVVIPLCAEDEVTYGDT
jgi:hypothetical protein